jgi:hypothetical protein
VTDQPKRIEIQLRGRGEDIIRTFQLRAFQTLTSATPVDTGFARGGWTPSVGSAIVNPERRPPGAGTKDDPGPNRGAISSAAQSKLDANRTKALAIAATYNLQQGAVFITNAVPYVVFLNEGSSAQAPKKFVERALQVALQSLSGG